MTTFNLHDLVLLLPEDFLLGAVCVILLVDLFLKPSQRGVTHWLSLLALLATGAVILADTNPDTIAFSGAYVHDHIAMVLKIFILGISAAVLVFGRGYLRARQLDLGEFYLLILFCVLGMLLLVSAGNLVMV